MIKIHKEILTDKSYVPSYTLKLQVTETDGNLTPCIFVHQYIPKNPMTNQISYDFQSVAYYDELTEVKDYVEDKKHVCLVRKSCVDKRFSTKESLDEFLAIVLHDIQRLLIQVNTVCTDTCEELTVTADAVATNPSTAGTETCVDTSKTEAIVLTFDGKLI